ncbi:MBL fold metallo-hydrolase [Alkalicaulis satelles]|uniref:MBL fold metallo-hydrolase n=1 Tax=Alkalicaulis satelles TaxID=2609175 RepID=A0A5M6ZFT9_9PROT|nr:MBL fold metallo-hydrolase [Alkalicaulis satelles]KAA5803616.1 MBL fold metallo-hydrolase [Alkalicaulis satelles]
MTLRARALAAAFCCTLPAHAQEAPPVETTDLGGGLYMLATHVAGNVGVSAGPDGVWMIDTQMAHLAPGLDEAQKAVSDGAEVRLVLNTHLHGDHVLGNAYFAERGALIMAHPSVRGRLQSPSPNAVTGNTPDPLDGPFLPVVGVSEGAVITLNGHTARIHHAPDAHTDGDLWVHFEEADVIHTGDLLFSGLYPFIDLDNGGTVAGMIAGMQAIADAAGPDTRIIPGHGPLSARADVLASIAMLSAAQEAVAALAAQDLSLEAVQDANPLAEFDEDWSWGFISTRTMTAILYRDAVQ